MHVFKNSIGYRNTKSKRNKLFSVSHLFFFFFFFFYLNTFLMTFLPLSNLIYDKLFFIYLFFSMINSFLFIYFFLLNSDSHIHCNVLSFQFLSFSSQIISTLMLINPDNSYFTLVLSQYYFVLLPPLIFCSFLHLPLYCLHFVFLIKPSSK